MPKHADAIADELFRHLFISVAEEMGVVLERTAYSPNIKERRDYSCALFEAGGALVAQAAHIPVHLGAFPLLMQEIVPRFAWRRGDVVICNDPAAGGTHLPDISVVAPVFSRTGRLAGFVANRAHHADVGGRFPGSMGPTIDAYQEGVIIPPLRLYEGGRLNEGVLELFLRNVRTPEERRGDLHAQLGALQTGERRWSELLNRYGLREVNHRARRARALSEQATRSVLGRFPIGDLNFTDALDDDGHGSGPLLISVRLSIAGDTLLADFSGSAPQQRGSVNATLAVTHAAVYYAIACLLPAETSLNAGVFAPIQVRAPVGSIVNAVSPAAVAAGNVETSQRIVDVVLGALAPAFPDRIPAASQGTMNNVTLGGTDPSSGRPWAYYETIGGGAGASPGGPGASGIHCHMSNTRNTPAEALEYHYPVRVSRYSVREQSGGAGAYPGGDGVVREMGLLAPATATLLTDRRARGPYGLAGGACGSPGENHRVSAGDETALPAKGSIELPAGAHLRIQTPGGGGWGAPEK